MIAKPKKKYHNNCYHLAGYKEKGNHITLIYFSSTCLAHKYERDNVGETRG